MIATDSATAWPTSLDSAAKRLLELLTDEEKLQLREMPADQLIGFHFALGMFIRNEFGLWRGNAELLASCEAGHPDNASTAIVKAAWLRLQPGSSGV